MGSGVLNAQIVCGTPVADKTFVQKFEDDNGNMYKHPVTGQDSWVWEGIPSHIPRCYEDAVLN